MDYYKILYFVNIIKNDCSEKEGQLKEIYDRAIRESDSYIELRELKERYSYFDNGIGRLINEESDELLNSVFKEPSKGEEILLKMKSVIETIHLEIKNSQELLEFPGILTNSVSVLESSSVSEYSKMLDVVASAAIYIFVVLGSVNVFSIINWNNNNTINRKLDVLEHDMLKKLVYEKKPLFFWKIVREHVNSVFRFADYRYRVIYISYDEYLNQISGSNRLNANLYVETGMEQNDIAGTVYLGMGNIVSCSPQNCIEQLAGKGIVIDTNIRKINANDIEIIKGESLLRILKFLSDGNNFSISPDMAVSFLNEYINGKVIIKRQNNKECLFCGKLINQGSVCRNHFNIERV